MYHFIRTALFSLPLAFALAACKGAPSLTDVAKAACAEQKAANVLGDIAAAKGNLDLARNAVTASQIAGIACAW